MDNHNEAAAEMPVGKTSEQSTQNADLATIANPAAKTEAKTELKTEGAGHEGVTYNPKMPEPQIINGVKVYPTSYIPAKAELHTPKKALVEFEGHHIELIHVVIFIGLTVALFIGMWKRPNLR